MVTIYHNPRCSKSRQTLALLREHGLEPEVIEYLQNPPTRAQLKAILKRLGLRPRELVRSGEEAYRANGLGDASLSDDALLSAMIEHPILIERPIVVVGDKAAIGRPPEKVLEIL